MEIIALTNIWLSEPSFHAAVEVGYTGTQHIYEGQKVVLPEDLANELIAQKLARPGTRLQDFTKTELVALALRRNIGTEDELTKHTKTELVNLLVESGYEG